MKGKEAGLFDNKALASLILPLLVEQFLAVLVGMADSIMVASVGEAAVSGVSLVDNVMIYQSVCSIGYRRCSDCRPVSRTGG